MKIFIVREFKVHVETGDVYGIGAGAKGMNVGRDGKIMFEKHKKRGGRTRFMKFIEQFLTLGKLIFGALRFLFN